MLLLLLPIALRPLKFGLGFLNVKMLLSDNCKVMSARIFQTSVFVRCGPGTSSNEGPGRAVFLLNSNSRPCLRQTQYWEYRIRWNYRNLGVHYFMVNGLIHHIIDSVEWICRNTTITCHVEAPPRWNLPALGATFRMNGDLSSTAAKSENLHVSCWRPATVANVSVCTTCLSHRQKSDVRLKKKRERESWNYFSIHYSQGAGIAQSV